MFCLIQVLRIYKLVSKSNDRRWHNQASNNIARYQDYRLKAKAQVYPKTVKTRKMYLCILISQLVLQSSIYSVKQPVDSAIGVFVPGQDYLLTGQTILMFYTIVSEFTPSVFQTPYVCHLLYLLSRREDVKLHRVRHLLQYQKDMVSNPALFP